jgi:hypothetical protein
MPDETTTERENADLRTKIAIQECAKEERKSSDSLYARKITETIVFGAIIIFALAALFFIFTKVGLPLVSLP